MILTALGWIAACIFLAAAVSSAWHATRDRSGGQVIASAAFAAGTITVLALLRALAFFPAVIAILAACGTAAAVTLVRSEGPGDVIGHLAEGIGLAGRHARETPGLLRRREPAASRADGEAPASAPEAAAEAVTARGIPSVADDPHLGPMTEPGEIAAGPAQAPAPYVQLAEMIAGFEPADDMELRAFMEGNAAGSVLVADAWHAFADTCLNGVGLDPAYVAGVLEAGDSSAGHGSLLAQVHKRFGVIYAQIKEWISGHGPLPKNARDFLSGEF